MGTEQQVRDGKTVILLGNFDGVHRGHAALVHEARRIAGTDGQVIAYTFRELTGRAPRLTDGVQREQLLLLAGADRVTEDSFERVRGFSPERFVSEVLCGMLHGDACVCGFNYRFGCGGSGDAALLRRLAEEAHMTCHVVAPVTEDGNPVSSTRVRGVLEDGNPEEALRLLGHPFSYRLPVLHGKKLGRTIGIPTVNQRIPDGFVRLKNGVYASFCRIGDVWYPAVTNVGFRPTVNRDGADITCETHIIGFSGDLYGTETEIYFLSYLREERKFPSLSALREAIGHNAAQAEALFSAYPRDRTGQPLLLCGASAWENGRNTHPEQH